MRQGILQASGGGGNHGSLLGDQLRNMGRRGGGDHIGPELFRPNHSMDLGAGISHGTQRSGMPNTVESLNLLPCPRLKGRANTEMMGPEPGRGDQKSHCGYTQDRNVSGTFFVAYGPIL